MTPWLLLVAAIVFEVAGTTSMKLSAGFTKVLPSVLLFVFYALAFGALTLTLKKMEVSFVYAIWSGLGTALVTLIGIYYFKESANIFKIASIGLIILGVVGLHFSSTAH
ncbi:MAG: multidrug efflux SMR transporter [Candidatus Deferrimicrobiaceae bacterium]